MHVIIMKRSICPMGRLGVVRGTDYSPPVSSIMERSNNSIQAKVFTCMLSPLE